MKPNHHPVKTIRVCELKLTFPKNKIGMNLKRAIMHDVTKKVCAYLNVKEDLVFTGGNHPRIVEARRYVSFLCVKDFKIDYVFIRKFFGLSEQSYLIAGYVLWIERSINEKHIIQTQFDIDNLRKIIESDAKGKTQYEKDQIRVAS